MLFENISVLLPDGSVKADCFVGVKGDRIDFVGAERPREDYGEGYNGAGKLLMPGFVNAHCHVPMVLLRGYAEDLPLERWLVEKIFPAEDKLNGEAVYRGSLLGIAEMIRSGVTSFSEMYFFCEDIARAVLESGIKCNLTQGITCFDDSSLWEMEKFFKAKNLYERYHNLGDGRLYIDMCIHAEYTSTPKVVREMAEYAKQTGARMQIHLSETKSEHEGCKERHGLTPAEYFESLGVFDVPCTAAHAVWVEESDIAVLSQKGVFVAHCPTSNLKLGSGIAPVAGMLEGGVKVALGTDGAASNNSLDMFAELKLAAILQKGGANDPELMPVKELLYMAARAGALSQGREDTGEIKVGCRADLVVLDLDSISMTPLHNTASSLVYSAGSRDVVLTMCDGRVLYRDGEFLTIDIELVKREVNKAIKIFY